MSHATVIIIFESLLTDNSIQLIIGWLRDEQITNICADNMMQLNELCAVINILIG